VLGVGYDYVDRVLGGDFPVKIVAMLAVLKIVATPTCYSSGNAGGIFGPSLFIGAMIGGATGGVAHSLFPSVTANPGAYALVGMGTAFAGIVRTPFTSVIMIFEMTRDYSIIVPLMISNMISFMISRRLQPEPIYEALALQEGVYLPTGEEREEMAGPPVGDLMSPDVPLLSPGADLETALSFLNSNKANAWPVGDNKSVLGLITREELEGAKQNATLVQHLFKADSYPYVHRDHPLSFALERMRNANVDMLPVVSRANIHELLGAITRMQILREYGI
jgi:CIC family chloride channel protein